MIKNLSECDLALVEKFRGCKLINESGVEEEVPVFFISSQREFTDVDLEELLAKEKRNYPCIVVFRNGVYQDVYGWRYDNSTYYENMQYDSEGNPMSAEAVKATDPYNIYYGLRIYYKYQQDGADLNFFITKQSKRGSYVIINEEGYDLEFLSYKNPEGTYRTFGEIKEKELKVLCDQYLFKLVADIIVDDSRELVKFNKETKFNLSTKGGIK